MDKRRIVSVAEQLRRAADMLLAIEKDLLDSPEPTPTPEPEPERAPSDVITEAEAARLWGVSLRTVQRQRLADVKLVTDCLVDAPIFPRYSRSRIEASIARSGRTPRLGR